MSNSDIETGWLIRKTALISQVSAFTWCVVATIWMHVTGKAPWWAYAFNGLAALAFLVGVLLSICGMKLYAERINREKGAPNDER